MSTATATKFGKKFNNKMYGKDHALEDEIPYHQKMARMSNARVSQDLVKTSRKLDKMKSDKFDELSREQKELQQKLQRLTKERAESRCEVEDVQKFLKEMKVRNKSPEPGNQGFSKAAKINKGVEKIMIRSHVPGSSEADPQLDTNVALKLLETLTINDKVNHKVKQVQMSGEMKQLPGKAAGPSATSALQLGSAAFAKKTPVSSSALTLTKPSFEDNYLASDSSNSAISTIDEEDKESTTTQETITSSDTLTDMGWLKARKIGKTVSEMPQDMSNVQKLALRKTITSIDNRGPQAENFDKNNMEALQNYYDMFMESQDCGSDSGSSQLAGKVNSSLSTYKRSQRRKVIALENLLKQLPSFKQKSERSISHKDALECRYLRLPQGTVREQERLCRDIDGVEPGIHAHMTEDDVINFLEGKPLVGSAEDAASASVDAESKHARLTPKRSSWM